jgi:hypothetical protein
MISNKRIALVLLPHVMLILLPFYDSYNLTTWINFASTFHNSQPAFYQSPWPGGFFALSVFIPLQITYVASGFDFYASTLIIKAILFLFTFLTALILYDIVKRGGDEKKAELVFLFTMLNPAILYVNYIWTQIDILPVFFLLLSYFLLRYEVISNNTHVRILVALVPLLVAVFLYLYPIILVPTLIYYTAKIKRKILLGVYALIYGLFFLALDTWAFRGALYNYIAAGSGTVINNSSVSGLQYYIKLSSFDYSAIVILLSLILPLIIKKHSFGENSCLLMVLLLFLFTSAVPLPDEFIWIYPFTVLGLFELDISMVTARKIALLNLFAFVGLIFMNLLVGTGFQQGIFYFGYNIFHLNYQFITNNTQLIVFSNLYNLCLLVSFLSTFAILVILRRPEWKQTYTTETIVRSTKRSIKWKLLAGYSIISLFLILAATNYNSMNNSIGTSDSPNVPIGLLYPASPYSAYVMPVLNATYWTTGNSVLFYPGGYTAILSRSLQNSNFDLTGTVSINGSPSNNIQLISMNNLTASILNEPYLKSNQGVAITPTYSFNVNATDNLESPRPSNQSIYFFNGNSSFVYDLNGSSLPANYYLFFFRPLSLASLQTIPFYMKSGNNVYEVVLYSNYALIANQNTSSGAWHLSNNIPYSFNSNSWNYIALSSNYTSLTINFNGYNNSFNTINLQKPVNITVGVPPVRNSSNYALTGYVTGIISSVTPLSVANRYGILLSNYNDSLLYYVNSLSNLNYHISVNDTHAMISIGNRSLATNVTNQNLGIGKLSPDEKSISWLIENVSIRYRGTGNYLLPVFFAFVIPYFVAFSILSYIYLKRKSRVQS